MVSGEGAEYRFGIAGGFSAKTFPWIPCLQKTKQCLINNIIFFSGLGDGDIDAGSSSSLWCKISNSVNIDNGNV